MRCKTGPIAFFLLHKSTGLNEFQQIYTKNVSKSLTDQILSLILDFKCRLSTRPIKILDFNYNFSTHRIKIIA